MKVLGPTLRYLDEWHSASAPGEAGSAVLEFESVIGDKTVHGVDMLRWDDTGRLTSFTVMARPFKGLEALIAAMAEELMKDQ